MKKIIIISTLTFILGLTVSGVTAAFVFNAKDISYTPTDTTWEVNNVSDAITYIQDNMVSVSPQTSDLIITGKAGKTLTITNVNNYKYYVVSGYYYTVNGNLSKCQNQITLTSVSNATYKLVGYNSRDNSSYVSIAEKSYIISPDGSGKDIELTYPGYDDITVYGVK